MITKNELDEFIHLKKQYSDIVDAKILERHNKIVQIGAYTASTDEIGKVVLSRTKFPTQFSESAAQTISNMNWLTGEGNKANVEILNARDWYKNKIIALDSIISYNMKEI